MLDSSSTNLWFRFRCFQHTCFLIATFDGLGGADRPDLDTHRIAEEWPGCTCYTNAHAAVGV